VLSSQTVEGSYILREHVAQDARGSVLTVEPPKMLVNNPFIELVSNIICKVLSHIHEDVLLKKSTESDSKAQKEEHTTPVVSVFLERGRLRNHHDEKQLRIDQTIDGKAERVYDRDEHTENGHPLWVVVTHDSSC